MKTEIKLAATKKELLEYSDSLADVLCWVQGFIAACPDDTNRHPLNVDTALRFHGKLKQLLRDEDKSNADRIISPERKSRWMNWYGPNRSGLDHETREQANRNASNFCTHVLEIITEDGKPVEVKIHEVTQKRATQGEG